MCLPYWIFPHVGPMVWFVWVPSPTTILVVQIGHSSCRERCTCAEAERCGWHPPDRPFIQFKKPIVGLRARNARPSQLDTTNANCVCGNSNFNWSERRKESKSRARRPGGKHRPLRCCLRGTRNHRGSGAVLELESPPSTKKKKIFYLLRY